MSAPNASKILRAELGDTSEPATITDVKQLSSYNWIEARQDTPTIAVPGSPALWTPPTGSTKVKKDTGFFYIAQNAARHPSSPLEPLFRAVYTTNPDFDIRAVDIVTDRNNIRKLLSFVDPGTSKNGLEAFTINIEVIKNTTIFCRDETNTAINIGPNQWHGYGHNFEKAYTTSKVNNSTGHHRIISYRFGDLTFVVRHEVDGYVDSGVGPSSQAPDDVADLLSGLRLSSKTLSASKLTIKEEGQQVPLSSTLEIKTRTARSTIQLGEVVSQLWVSQTPKLVRAYHDRGTFQSPAVEDMVAYIKSWEASKKAELGKLAALIHRIVVLVKECGGSAVVKYDPADDCLVVTAVEKRKFLPDDLYAKWEEK